MLNKLYVLFKTNTVDQITKIICEADLPLVNVLFDKIKLVSIRYFQSMHW